MCLMLPTPFRMPTMPGTCKEGVHLAALSVLGSGIDIQFKATKQGGGGKRWTFGKTGWLWNKSVVEWGVVLSVLTYATFLPKAS